MTETALRTAKAVVVLWSKKSVVSRWVRAEATLADRNKTLVPCMIEPCERPIMFELTQTAELAHWQGDATDKAWLAFLTDVKRFVAKEAAPAVAAPTTPLAAPTVEETLKPGQSGSAPSLAVLPFTNRSSLPEDEVFAEGMVEDVISALSQGVNVRVLGSTATANLSRAAITDLAALGRQLGVRYLLEGNVRRVGANLRVTTQLLEAATGAIDMDREVRPSAGRAGRASGRAGHGHRRQPRCTGLQPGDGAGAEEAGRHHRLGGGGAKLVRLSQVGRRRRVGAASRKRSALSPSRRTMRRGMPCSPYALANAYLVSPDDPAEVQRIRAIAERALALAPDDASVLGSVGHALCYCRLSGRRRAPHRARCAQGARQRFAALSSMASPA